jgi:hypothetical protein
MSPELKPNPEYDAAISHGYWMSDHKTGLSLRSRLSTRAAAVEYKAGKVGKLFFNLDKMWGPEYPSEASLVRRELEEHYHVPSEDIVTQDNAWSTGAEVNSFVDEARRRGWRKTLDIAFKPHTRLTIPLIYKRQGAQADLKTVEDILTKDDIHRFKGVYKVKRPLNLDKNGNDAPWREVPITERRYEEAGIKGVLHEHNHTARLVRKVSSVFSRSNYGRVYWLYEGIKWVLMHRPGFNYQALEDKNKQTRIKPTEDSPLPLRFDVYKLPKNLK